VAGSPRAAGYGQNFLRYLKRANNEILIMVAVETPEAVANLDEILAVPEIDAIFIGPMDLATSMGHLFDPSHAEVQKTIGTIETKVRATQKALATVAGSWEQAHTLYERGYQMLMLMADGVALGKLASTTVAKFREVYPEG
jgi:2-dehydro-3-deoxyglucarate aldolase/4-hydroxy-2-oxoheptanedioate aldolase